MADRGLSYCALELRHQDRDRFQTCLFAPAARREALFALYAFNLEVAKTAELVSEPMLGQIRLQWWRDTLDRIYAGAPRRHQVAEPLADAVRRHDLTRAHFDRLIDARELDLTGQPPASLGALERYADSTSGSLQLLALEVLGVAGDAPRAAARQVGIAYALTGLLRAVPFHARQKRIYLPADVAAETGLELRDLYALRATPALRATVARVGEHARSCLAQARAAPGRLPRAALPALLPATLAGRYLAILARAGHDPFAPAVQAPPPSNVWRLAAAALLRRY